MKNHDQQEHKKQQNKQTNQNERQKLHAKSRNTKQTLSNQKIANDRNPDTNLKQKKNWEKKKIKTWFSSGGLTERPFLLQNFSYPLLSIAKEKSNGKCFSLLKEIPFICLVLINLIIFMFPFLLFVFTLVATRRFFSLNGKIDVSTPSFVSSTKEVPYTSALFVFSFFFLTLLFFYSTCTFFLINSFELRTLSFNWLDSLSENLNVKMHLNQGFGLKFKKKKRFKF